MKRKVLSIAFSSVVILAQAGGYLTNTNQNVAFLRNPAQDASINLNGVYSNPAGVSFLSNGIHLGINWQSAFQTREVISTFSPFAYGLHNNNQTTKQFEAVAQAPFIPSVQFAWIKNRWNLQFNFAIIGGGGKAEFERGMPSFESQIALLGMIGDMKKIGFNKYDMNAYMSGKQYYYGFTIGSGYKINENWSGYLGIRGVYGSANYYGYLKDIQINAGANGAMTSAPQYFAAEGKKYGETALQAELKAQELTEQAKALESVGKAEEAQQAKVGAAGYMKGAAAAKTAAQSYGVLAAATQDLVLNADQSSFGVAPIIGLHYHSSQLDAAVKYEFGTRMEFSNKSANSQSANNLASLAPYKDGTKVRGDIPGLLTLGVQYRPIRQLSINAGYHHYFDKQASSGLAPHWKNELLNGNTQEILFGVEYNLNNQWEISTGLQRTLYPNTDDYMNDLSFTVNSTSLGLGIGYRINDNVKINAAYFQTFYDKYTKTTNDYNNTSKIVGLASGSDVAKTMVDSGTLKGKDVFTRSNQVFGIGVELFF